MRRCAGKTRGKVVDEGFAIGRAFRGSLRAHATEVLVGDRSYTVGTTSEMQYPFPGIILLETKRDTALEMYFERHTN